MRISDWSSDVCSSDLPSSYEDFTSSFSAGTRRADRAKQRKLEGLGRVEFRIAETGDEARRMTADILDRKAAQLRAQGISSIFEDAGYCAAYISQIGRSGGSGKSVSVRVDLGGR